MNFLKARSVLLICTRALSSFPEQDSGLINTRQFSDGGWQGAARSKAYELEEVSAPSLSELAAGQNGSDEEISFQPSVPNV